MEKGKQPPGSSDAPFRKGQLREFRRSPRSGSRHQAAYAGRERRERQRHHVPQTFVRFQKRLLCFPLNRFSGKFPSRNIHSHGVSFRSLKPVKVGSKLLVNIGTSILVHAFRDKCAFIARVVWVDKLANRTYWRVGCEILGKKGCKEIAELVRDGALITRTHERDIL